MNKKDNYRDIYELLQAETDLPLPESLQPAAIADFVSRAELQPKKRPIARCAGLAAAIVLVVLAGVLGWQFSGGLPTVQAPTEQNASAADTQNEFSDEYLRSAESYAEIEQFFLEQQQEYKRASVSRDIYNGYSFGAKSKEFVADNGAAMPGGAAPDGTVSGSTAAETAQESISDSDDYGQTNTQVKAVDEADILKNDGNYLYIVRTQSDSNGESFCFVDIIDIRSPREMRSVATIQPTFSAENAHQVIQDLYLNGDTLTVISCVYAKTAGNSVGREIACYNDCYASAQKTAAEVYDITDRAAPQLRFSYAVDGSLLSSRMTGSTLLLLTNYQVPLYKNETDLKNACVPCYYAGEEKLRFPIRDVKLLEGTTDSAYLTVSLLDTETESPAPEVKAVLGGGSDVYCSTDTLLVAQRDTSEAISYPEHGMVSLDSIKAATRLFAFNLLSGADYKGSVRIEGTVLNQFSMDAYNGYYRIATTVSGSGSSITVLNENLEIVGQVDGIAKGEQIYAVRFLGDTAYLVTFYQTDPLFIVDLSNPQKPEITGELKIPGFSNYLHPYSDTLLIGIGEDGTESGTNGHLKISLFDVSDKQHPREVSKIVYDNTDYSFSAAQSDHKAYLSFGENGEFAVPVQEDVYFTNSRRAYVSVLTVENGVLKIAANYMDSGNDAQFYISRATYAGSTVFALSENCLTAFDKATGEVLSTIRY